MKDQNDNQAPEGGQNLQNDQTEPVDPAELSFEEALAELESLTARMAAGDMTLAQSVRAYERGAKLLRCCRGELEGARVAIERIRVENESEGDAPSL